MDAKVTAQSKFHAALDKTLSLGAMTGRKRVQHHRKQRPEASPREIIELIEKEFRLSVTGQGAATGAAATIPGTGTAWALAMAGGDIVSSAHLTASYVFAIAEVHDISLTDLDRKRTLLFTVLLGKNASTVAARVAGRTGKYWSAKLVDSIPLAAIKNVNKILGPRFLTRYGAATGIVVLGKTVPFGIGAALGGGLNYVQASAVIRGAREAFGEPPEEFSDTSNPTRPSEP